MTFKAGTSDRPYSTIDGIPYIYDSPKAFVDYDTSRFIFREISGDFDASDGSDYFLGDTSPFTGNQRMIYGGGKVFFTGPRHSEQGTNSGKTFVLYPGRVHQNNKSKNGYLYGKNLKSDDVYFGSFYYNRESDKSPGWDDGTPWEVRQPALQQQGSQSGKSIAYTAGLIITGTPVAEDATNSVLAAGGVEVQTDAHQSMVFSARYHSPAFYGNYYYGDGSSGIGGIKGGMNSTSPATGNSANYMGLTVSARSGKMVVGFNTTKESPTTVTGEDNMVWIYDDVTDIYSPFDNNRGKVLKMKDIPIAKWYFDNSTTYTEWGYSHDIGCGRIVIGARREDILDEDGNTVSGYDRQGAIYIFDYRGNLLRRVENPTPNSGGAKGLFGQRVKIGGGRIVASGYGQSCHVFDLDGNHINDLRQNAGLSLGSYDGFGNAMDVGFGYIAIGMPGYFISTGRVYLFDLDGNYLTFYQGPGTSQSFGRGVALGPGQLYMGAEGPSSGRGWVTGRELNYGRGIFTPYDIQAMEDGDK